MSTYLDSVRVPNSTRDLDALIRRTIFWVPAVISLIYVILDCPGLPEKFRFDSTVIYGASQGSRGVDDSYLFIARVYGFLGLGGNTKLASIFTLICFLAIVLVVYFRYAPIKPTLTMVSFLIIIDLLGAVYLGQMTKELFVLVVPALYYVLPPKRINKNITVAATAILIGVEMRQYWLIVATVFLTLTVSQLKSRWPKFIYLLGICLSVYLLLPAIYQNLFHENLELIRVGINLSRISSDAAQSMINPYFDYTNTWLELVNLMSILVFFFLPIPLLFDFNLMHGIYGISLIFISSALIFSSSRIKSAAERRQILPGLNLIIAFVITQAVFEPDYGSFLRHLTPILIFALEIVLISNKGEIGVPE